MKLIDTHCHVSFNAYKEDAKEVVQRALDEGIWMLTVGTQTDTSRSAVELANQFEEGVYAAIGLHPTHAVAHGFNDTQELDFKPREEVFNPAHYEPLLNEKVVAIGECGFDYYRLPDGDAKEIKKKQHGAFMAQAEFAAKHDRPLVIHCRDAHDDQFAAIKSMPELEKRRGVIHCFTGTYEEAKRYVDVGWFVSFSGIATFAKEVGEVARKLPVEQMLVETDAPYLTPPPHRGKRNEPAYVRFVAEHIAQLKGMPYDQFAQQVVANAKVLFRFR